MSDWRVGEHYNVHIYEGDRPVATFHKASDAEKAVAAHNMRETDNPNMWLFKIMQSYWDADKTWRPDIREMGSVERVWRKLPQLIEMARPNCKIHVADEDDTAADCD